MTQQLKFVDGVYGFVYDSIHGHVSKVFREPISEIERRAMNKVIGICRHSVRGQQIKIKSV